MAVITPVFPPMNSCHAVVHHTKTIMLDEIFRASLISQQEIKKIRDAKAAIDRKEQGTKDKDGNKDGKDGKDASGEKKEYSEKDIPNVEWGRFYEALPFFTTYSKYIRICVSAKNRDKYVSWKGKGFFFF